MPWIRQAVADVLGGNIGYWRELLASSKSECKGLRDLADVVNTRQISVPARLERTKLRYDAEAMRRHFESGGRMRTWYGGRPKTVRDHGDFLDVVKVDGSECLETKSLETLIAYLDLEQHLKNVWHLWMGKVREPAEPFLMQVARIEGLNEALENVVQIHGLKEKAAESIGGVSGLPSPKWEERESLLGFIETCRAIKIQRFLARLRKNIQDWEASISRIASQKNAHPIATEILQALGARDFETYARLANHLAELSCQVEQVAEKDALLAKLKTRAPQFVARLIAGSERELWANRLLKLEKAWAWARATAWLEEFLNNDSVSLERSSAGLEADIRGHLAELASVKAWDFCFSRMEDEHRRPLGSMAAGHGKAWKGHRQVRARVEAERAEASE